MRKIDNHIKNLTIEDSENIEIKDCRKLNILIGENNTGKTNILLYIKCLKNNSNYRIEYSNPLDYLLEIYDIDLINKIIKRGEKHKIIEILKLFEESIFDFNILSDGQIIVNLKNREGENISIGISNFGDGMKKLLFLFPNL